jgi:hypothetical protein
MFFYFEIMLLAKIWQHCLLDDQTPHYITQKRKTLHLDMPPPLSLPPPHQVLFSQSSDVAKKFGNFWL